MEKYWSKLFRWENGLETFEKWRKVWIDQAEMKATILHAMGRVENSFAKSLELKVHQISSNFVRVVMAGCSATLLEFRV